MTEPTTTVQPMTVACPMCGAKVGTSCGIVWGGYMIHAARANAAYDAQEAAD